MPIYQPTRDKRTAMPRLGIIGGATLLSQWVLVGWLCDHMGIIWGLYMIIWIIMAM